MNGYWLDDLRKMHEKYGNVVRIAPDELSYLAPEAWEDVYGRDVPGKRLENLKPTWYQSPADHNVVGALTEDHKRMRKVMHAGFTYSAFCQQEPLMKIHVDNFITGLKSEVENGPAKVNILSWLTNCMFDLVGDLGFGEKFGALENKMDFPWVDFMYDFLSIAYLLQLMQRIPFFFVFVPFKLPIRLFINGIKPIRGLQEIVNKRLASKIKRDDFLYVMSSKKTDVKTSEEVVSLFHILPIFPYWRAYFIPGFFLFWGIFPFTNFFYFPLPNGLSPA